MAAQRAFHKQLYGQNVPRPMSVRINAAVATVTDCQKSDGAGVQDARTGEKLTVGRARNLVTATLRVSDDGIWKIATIAYAGSSC